MELNISQSINSIFLQNEWNIIFRERKKNDVQFGPKICSVLFHFDIKPNWILNYVKTFHDMNA